MKKYSYSDKKGTRSGFGEGLLKAAKNNKNILLLNHWTKMQS